MRCTAYLRSRAALSVVVGVVLTASGCAPESEPLPLNVVLISIDTLRADHLKSYGYDRDTAPTVDGLAARGVQFDNAVANSPWTLPSHASMLTGLYPRTHGLKNHDTGLRAGIPTLATVLLDDGYRTMGVVNSHNLGGRYGLHRGFQKFRLFEPRANRQRVRSGRKQVEQAIAWLEEASDEPFFLFIHNYDVHSDYDPSPAFLENFARPYEGKFTATTRELRRVRSGAYTMTEADAQHTIDRYDGGIRQLDADLSRLLDYLDQRGLSETTLVIVTSDHGEEFLEHGGVLHGRTMYNEVLNVPLILSGPGLPSGLRVPGVVQLTDIFPTVLDLAGVESPQVEGLSLVPAWKEGGFPSDDRLAYAEADHNNAQPDIKRMVKVGHAKLIYDRLTDTYEMYDLSRDPRELTNIAAQDPETVHLLTTHLDRYAMAETDGVALPPLSGEELENLRALGYVD